MTVLHLEVETARSTMQYLKRLVADLYTYREMVRRMGQQLAAAWQGPAAEEFQYHMRRWFQRLDQVMAEMETLAQLGEREVEEWVAADQALAVPNSAGTPLVPPSASRPQDSLRAGTPTPYRPERLYAALGLSLGATWQAPSGSDAATPETVSLRNSWDAQPWMEMAGLPGSATASPEVGKKEPGGISYSREASSPEGRRTPFETVEPGESSPPPGAASPSEGLPLGTGRKSPQGTPRASGSPSSSPGGAAPMPSSTDIESPGQAPDQAAETSLSQQMDVVPGSTADIPSSIVETRTPSAAPEGTSPSIPWPWLGLAGVVGASALGYLLYRMTRTPTDVDHDTQPIPGLLNPNLALPEHDKSEEFLTLDTQAQAIGRAEIGQEVFWLSTGLPQRQDTFPSRDSVREKPMLYTETPHPGTNTDMPAAHGEFEAV